MELDDKKNNAATRLGTEPVGKLLLRFSIPAIAGMLSNALYNVVDRIFVGQEISLKALGGLSLVMPIMTIGLAFAMLFGIGAANMISMRLGQGRKQDAENALNHCFFLLLGIGALMIIFGLIFLDPILSLLGAQEDSSSIEYAKSYLRIILVGSIFSQVGFGLSHCTRAQGFPVVTMIAMLIGAGLNIILDWFIIYVLEWKNVESVAWGTVICQFISMAWILSFYMGKKAVIKFRLRSFKPSLSITTQIMAFGSAQFLLQLIMAGVQLLYNVSMGWFGVADLEIEKGGDIALSGMSAITAINMLILMPVLGINQGAQPILGYNYGAKQFGRVMNAYLKAITAASIICIAGFAVAELFPVHLIKLFTSASSGEGVTEEEINALMKFAPQAMRLMFIMLPTAGFQIVSTNLFVVTGRPKISIFLSMLRQCLILIPCMLIFGQVWKLWGVVAAAPVSDAFAFFITGVMIFFELKKLKAAQINGAAQVNGVAQINGAPK